MQLAISNIAWTKREDAAIMEVIRSKGVDKIEAAPMAFFGRPLEEMSEAEVLKTRDRWEASGIHIVAMQALLFGKSELSLFESDSKRDQLADFLRMVIDTASWLGAGPLVFGSPKNRIRGDLAMSEAMPVATKFFGEMAPYAADRGCTLCIEPNAAGYGCDFITRLNEAAELVESVNHPGVGLQVDTGVMAMNGEVSDQIADYASLIAHVHCSEPFLAPVARGDKGRHRAIAAALLENDYKGMISIEMKRDNDKDNLSHVGNGIDFAVSAYSAFLGKNT